MTESEGLQGNQYKEELKKRRMERRNSNPAWRDQGERLLAVRKSKNLTQKDLAKLFQIKNGQAQISAYEKGTIPTGKHIRKNYAILLDVNPEYIESGTFPMFLLLDKQRKTTAERLLSNYETRSGGNMRLVTGRTMGQFLNTGATDSMNYPFIAGDCWSFPVQSPEMGPDFPAEAHVICTRLNSASGLLTGRVYVFQTEDKLLVRYYAGYDADYSAYRLKTSIGPKEIITASDTVEIYHIERIDRLVL